MKTNDHSCSLVSMSFFLALCLSGAFISTSFAHTLNYHSGLSAGIRAMHKPFVTDSGGAGRFTVVLKNSRPSGASAAATRKSLSISTSNESLIDRTNIRFQTTSYNYSRNGKGTATITVYEKEEILIYAIALLKYARQHGYDTSYAFLANMAMGATQKRFFIVNLKTLEIENSGLVSQGFGNFSALLEREYSNKPGSKCTSLGKYSISGKYSGTYGFSYRLKGLDSSNSNALKRKIVLHSMHCIPDKEGYAPACSSEGCPAVSKQFFVTIRNVVESGKKPVLLWVYDSNLEKPVVELPQAVVERLKFFERW